jgi:hypothetical protein
MPTDRYGYPDYVFSDELAAPSEVGIRREGNTEAIIDSVTGVNYYVDSIAFGSPTGLAALRGGNFARQTPLGVRFFAKTGLDCSNGARMYEYVSTVPAGDALGETASKAVQGAGLPEMKGLVPGILEDARDALNPLNLFSAAITSGYPKCKQVTLPVGDTRNRIASSYEPENRWIRGPVTYGYGGVPMQTRWVLDSWLSEKDWLAEPKTHAPKRKTKTSEGFQNPLHSSQIAAILLFSAVVVGVMVCKK